MYQYEFTLSFLSCRRYLTETYEFRDFSDGTY